MMVRRRPIARAAVVGGVAYSASKHGAAAGEQQAAEQAAAPAPTGGMSEAAMQQLKELAALHESGVLTDEEFEAQKAKLLGG
jgi:hypothetical protein